MESKYIFKAYSFFFRGVYSRSPIYNQTNQKLCVNFIELLQKQYKHLDSVGLDYLWNYFIFQFEYWKKLDLTKQNNKKIDLSYTIGKRAFDRYLKRNQQYDWTIEQDARAYDKEEFKQKVNLPTIITLVQNQDSCYDADEIYREQHLNEEIGLSNCIILTSLWSPLSKSCRKCIFQEQCIPIQKQLYPTINRNRKIANDNQQQATAR